VIVYEIVQAAIIAIIYGLFVILRNGAVDADPFGGTFSSAQSYVWGLLFATLFYFLFPLWWWRYGLWRTLYMICLCVGIKMVIKLSIGASGFVGTLESILLDKTLSIPIMVGAGLWVARNDREWRRVALLKRADMA